MSLNKYLDTQGVTRDRIMEYVTWGAATVPNDNALYPIYVHNKSFLEAIFWVTVDYQIGHRSAIFGSSKDRATVTEEYIAEYNEWKKTPVSSAMIRMYEDFAGMLKVFWEEREKRGVAFSSFFLKIAQAYDNIIEAKDNYYGLSETELELARFGFPFFIGTVENIELTAEKCLRAESSVFDVDTVEGMLETAEAIEDDGEDVCLVIQWPWHEVDVMDIINASSYRPSSIVILKEGGEDADFQWKKSNGEPIKYAVTILRRDRDPLGDVATPEEDE